MALDGLNLLSPATALAHAPPDATAPTPAHDPSLHAPVTPNLQAAAAPAEPCAAPPVNVQMPGLGPHPVPQQTHTPRKLVLCFDGTGNKFHGDDSDSNILMLFRMLDRTAHDQFHYYQPGIGTYVQTDDLSHTGIRERCKAWIKKAKDSAIGSSFDQHVVGGYRFLMRYYNHGDEIYIFGFSRGAYIARFLAEMLDMVGLLSHGNEEMIYFAWKTFSQWQCRSAENGPAEDAKKHKMYAFMKAFRETFSRPVRRIRFLGLFDTVNSVPRFEAAWMRRTNSPYTARSRAKVIRHAVSIDERRAKFRQDLMYQPAPTDIDDDGIDDSCEASLGTASHMAYRCGGGGGGATPARRKSSQAGLVPEKTPRAASRRSASRGRSPRTSMANEAEYERYRCPSRSRSRAPSVVSLASGMSAGGDDRGYDSEDDPAQDIDEVWFAGGHGDVGGGWDVDTPGCKNASHIPLTWMVREAARAGLHFDVDKVIANGCAAALRDIDPARADAQAIPDIHVDAAPSSSESSASGEKAALGGGSGNDVARAAFHSLLSQAEKNRIHDSLVFGGGLTWGATLSWRVMEYLPFRRMDLQADGSWKPICWPLPRGETRDMPHNARIHGSVIRRMQEDPKYRPGNLIVGGGGRGVRVAPERYGMGEWVCVSGHGDPVAEVWVRKGAEQV